LNQAELAALWRKRLDDIVSSELTVEKWCEINGTTVRQYGYWRKRLGYTQVKCRPRSTQWIAVTCEEPLPQHSSTTALTLRIAGAEIDLQPGFNPDLLRSIVAALAAKPC